MAKFLDALLGRTHQQPVSLDPATIAQPVPVAMVIQPPSDLTSGSALNQAAVGAWPKLLDAGAKFWSIGGWRKSVLKEVENINVPGNYGMVSSLANFGFRWRAFDGIGNLSGPAPSPYRPTYDDLVPVVWNLRIANPAAMPQMIAQKGPITVQRNPSTWEGANTASLNRKGEVLL